MSTQQLRSIFLRRLTALLSPLGYKKRSDTFVMRLEEVSRVIHVQSSTSGTSDGVVVTINLGIYSHVVAQREGASIDVKQVWDCHWRVRLGYCLPEPYDQWWTIEDEAQALETGDLIVRLLNEYGLPALAALPDTESLRRLWLGGESIRTTEYLRSRYLALLDED